MSTDDSILSKEVPLTEKKILELIEAAYPHPVTIEDLAKQVDLFSQISTHKHCLISYLLIVTLLACILHILA